MKIRALFGVALAMGLSGCTASDCPPCRTSSSDTHAMHQAMGMGGAEEACPNRVPGTTVAATDVEGGVALVFTTTNDVGEVRRRVEHMAAMHTEHHGEGGGMMGETTHAEHDDDANPAMRMPASTVTTEDSENGVRLIFLATNAADVAQLRAHLRLHVESMNRGECPTMSRCMEGHPMPPSSGGEHDAHH